LALFLTVDAFDLTDSNLEKRFAAMGKVLEKILKKLSFWFKMYLDRSITKKLSLKDGLKDTNASVLKQKMEVILSYKRRFSKKCVEFCINELTDKLRHSIYGA
jgi:hypothetical protein